MLPKMEDKKATDSAPAFVITSAQTSRPSRKYVIIGVSCIVAVAIILAAILVGMHIFTEGQKEILQFSLSRDDGAKKDDTSVGLPIVQYHVKDPNYETWIVNDFNTNIQLLKIQTPSTTKCILAPLGEQVKVDDKLFLQSYYSTANSPISDTSFLGKEARDTCEGMSIYWLHPNPDVENATRFRRQKERQINFLFKRDDGSLENVTSDPEANWVHYHVMKPPYQTCKIDDFNRDLQVIKVETDQEKFCYVSRLNRSLATRPSEIRPPPKGVEPQPNITAGYRAEETPIEDTSFLGELAQETCKGIQTYWMRQTNLEPSDVDRLSGMKYRFIFGSCCTVLRFWFFCIIICWC